MEKLDKSDYKLAAIRIHLDGVAFYRAAFNKNHQPFDYRVYIDVMEDALRQIDEIVNGKAKG